ncbi:MAG TPA: CbiX/SirB N-terminal domain-containing protein [Actinoplanes sp.]|nr:CbiX/SirB N-terminal domain-containing protein [Actinoplanes sp.]
MRSARLIGGHRPAVVLVAHGSRDPRAAASTEALARAVQHTRPEWLVRASYLDHDGPRPLDVLAALPGTRAVLVPLLLTAAYHGRVDLPAVIRDAATLPVTVTATDVLGPASPLLLAALNRRLSTAPGHFGRPDGPGHPGCQLIGGSFGSDPACCGDPAVAGLDAVVLAAAGTRDDAARGTVADAATALGTLLGLPSAVSYASGPGPRADEAVTRLRAEGARRVGVAAYFLAPGLLYDAAMDAARSAGAVTVAQPLGDAPELVRLVATRAESILTHSLATAA